MNLLNQVLLLLHEAAAALGRSVGGVVCVQLAFSSGGHDEGGERHGPRQLQAELRAALGHERDGTGADGGSRQVGL